MDQKTKEQISAYHDGELDAAEMAEVRALIMRDPKAKAYLGELQELSTQLASMPIRPAPSDLAQAVLDDLGLERAADAELTTQSAASAKLRAVASAPPSVEAEAPPRKPVRIFDRRWFPSAAAACLVVAAAAGTYIYQEISDRSTERMMNTVARDETPLPAGSAIESFGAMPHARPSDADGVAHRAESAQADGMWSDPEVLADEADTEGETPDSMLRLNSAAAPSARAGGAVARTAAPGELPTRVADGSALTLDLSSLPVATLSASGGSTTADAILERALRHFTIRAGQDVAPDPEGETEKARKLPGTLGAPGPKEGAVGRDDDPQGEARRDGVPAPAAPKPTESVKPESEKPSADGKSTGKAGDRLRDDPAPPKSAADKPRAEPPASGDGPAAREVKPADIGPPPPSAGDPGSGGGGIRGRAGEPLSAADDAPRSDDANGEAAKRREADTSLYRVLSRQANPAGGEDVVIEVPKSRLAALLHALRFESADAGGTFAAPRSIADAPTDVAQPKQPVPDAGSTGQPAPESGPPASEAQPAAPPAAEERVRIVIRLR